MLDNLIGNDVRVATSAFSPVAWGGASWPHLIPVGKLILPDNTLPDGIPVFFEGRLQKFERQIGVVFVSLEAITSPDTAKDGHVYFRGRSAVVIRGPAVVQMAFPFQVEKLPADESNYWRDLRFARAQFELPFSSMKRMATVTQRKEENRK